jgi:glycosyltransferase involved in cell wall biosynthesis
MKLVMIGSDPGNGLLYHPTRLAVELARQGHEVHVVSRPGREQSPGLTEQLAAAGVELHEIRSLARSGIRAMLRGAPDLRSRIRALRPDAIHVFGAVTAFQVRGTGPRCVAMIEGMGHNMRWRWPARLGALSLNRSADQVLALCEAEQARLVGLGVDSRRLAVLHNFIDCDDFLRHAGLRNRSLALQRAGLDLSGRYLGCFANFHPRKRQRLLLEAFANVAPRHLGWTLVLAGDGIERQRCEALAHSLGLARRVRFLGRLATADAIPLLAAMDAAVHCSAGETFGYSMIEPLLLKLPTLLTRIAIGREVERAGAGLVVAPDDVPALTSGLDRLLNRDHELMTQAALGPAFVRRTFDVGRIAESLVAFYRGSSTLSSIHA